MKNESKQLSFEELENYIEDILSGYKIVRIKNYEDKDRIFIFKHSSLKERKYSQMIYDTYFDEARETGLKTIKEMLEIIKQRGFFTEEDEAAIESIENKIFAQRQVLKKTFRILANKERLENIISNLQEEAREISAKKEKMLQFTCEAKASERRTYYLLVNCCLDVDSEEPTWSSIKEFEDSKDDVLKLKLLTRFVDFITGIKVSTVRQIARDSQWRLRYVISKKLNIDLFGKSVKDFTVDQLNLMQWSDYYSSIYEMLPEDRPPDSIIDSDLTLDAYMEEYFEERNREEVARKGAGSKKSGKIKSAYDHDEVIVTHSNPLHKDIDYSKVPNKITKSESIEVTERSVQERDKYKNRRIGTPPPPKE